MSEADDRWATVRHVVFSTQSTGAQFRDPTTEELVDFGDTAESITVTIGDQHRRHPGPIEECLAELERAGWNRAGESVVTTTTHTTTETEYDLRREKADG